MVDKIGEIYYVVKSKTNRKRKFPYFSGESFLFAIKFYYPTYQLYFLGGDTDENCIL